MKVLLCCLISWALPVLGQGASVAVFTDFKEAPPDPVVDAMKSEVESLISATGFHLEWKSLRDVRLGEVFTDVAIARFQGDCSTNKWQPGYPESGVLAWTDTVDGRVLPFAHINCDRIHALITRNVLALPEQRRDAVVGRAIGRVLTHELCHIFARTMNHGLRAVDRPALTADQLTEDHFVAKGEIHILRVGLPGNSRARADPQSDKMGSAEAGLKVYVESGCARCHGWRGEGTKGGPPLQAMADLTSVLLAARLERYAPAMLRRATHLKASPPSVNQDDLEDLTVFLMSMQKVP